MKGTMIQAFVPRSRLTLKRAAAWVAAAILMVGAVVWWVPGVS